MKIMENHGNHAISYLRVQSIHSRFTCAYAPLKLPGFEEISSREIPSTSCFAPTRKIRDSVTILALWLETKKVGFLLKIP